MNHARRALLVVAALAGSLEVGATPEAKQLLTAPIQEMQKAGYSGAGSAAVPPPPAVVTPVAVQAQSSSDHDKDVLKKYAAEILAMAGPQVAVQGTIAQKLGFSQTPSDPWLPNGNMPLKGVGRRNNSTQELKIIAVTAVRGKTEILLTYQKGNEEIRAYLIMLDGTFESAARATQQGVAEIPADQAQTGFQNELGFWVRYYDKNHP